MKYSNISLEKWKQIGEGGNGATYIHLSEPDVMLKVSYLDSTEEAMNKEFLASKAVYDLGIPTPEMIQLVQVGKNFGIVCQLIKNKKSIARLCNEDPEHLDDLAKQMAEQTKKLHSTIVPSKSYLPSIKELMLTALERTHMLTNKTQQAATEYIANLQDTPNLLHGDLQMGNLILSPQSTPEYFWIDLGRAAHGVPMFDLGHLFLFCNVFSKTAKVQEITHMTEKQMSAFWNAFALAYNGPDKLEEFNTACKRFAALDVILLGHIQKLNWHQRLFLGFIAKRLFKASGI